MQKPIILFVLTTTIIAGIYLYLNTFYFVLETHNTKNYINYIHNKPTDYKHSDFNTNNMQPRKSFILSSTKVYNGNYETELRIRLKIQDKFYYSNTYSGTINYSQFSNRKK